MGFNDFVHKHKLRNKATSNIKIQQVLNSIGLNNVGIYLRDEPFSSDIGIVNLHPSKGTHCICYINENYFDSYGCVCPKKLSKFFYKTKWLLFVFRISNTKKMRVIVPVIVCIKFPWQKILNLLLWICIITDFRNKKWYWEK